MPDPLDGLPGNLSRRATSDFLSILRQSEVEWGEDTARQTRARLLRRFAQIAGGTATGHERRDVKPRTPTLFLNEDPWVIAYRPATRQVLQVFHGVMDFETIYPTRE